ncbi:baseplate tail tube cap [Synechococcus phage S-CAM22]|nr:baseplate tail tube cap [Synechococcus phage S-CAM22]AOV61267.1 baseplate tail tube cap [Synechococcus phage S-CAM22]
MFQRKRINYDDGNGTNYYGLNVPNNKVAVENNKARIYIAMPQNLQTAYQPTYRKVDMGVMGMAMAEGLSSSDLDGVVTALQTAASSALPEFATGALAQVAQGAAQMLGLAGNADANALQALTQGKVFNPYSEQLFSNMQFRTHNFSFKMFARSERESQEINNIIKYLKQGSLPIYGDSDEGKPARFFEVPDKFDIKFVRLSPDGKTLSDSEDLHYKIHTSVCTGIDVNYTPDGQYNAIKNNNLGTGDDKPLQVPVVNINCRFTETQLVTQQQIKEGF